MADYPTADAVTFYWHPSCGFCLRLRRGLAALGVPVVERNIWDDADAAAFVRRHAGGNETVPTVDVGGTVLVNPHAARVAALATAAGIPIGEGPAPPG